MVITPHAAPLVSLGHLHCIPVRSVKKAATVHDVVEYRVEGASTFRLFHRFQTN
jgi:hypothetical protein